MYQNYIFDLYGTLIDINTNENKRYLWDKMAEWYGFHGAHYTAPELKKAYNALVKESLNAPSPYQYPEIELPPVFQALYRQKGIAASDELVLHTGQMFRILSTKFIYLYDGVIDLLDTLRGKGKRLYVLSNAQRMFTEYEMRLLQIYDRFDGIVFSSDEGCMKPDPAFYQVVLDRYQLDKRASIMIGNDAVADILGANHAGLDSLYLHSDLSPEIEGELQSTFSVLDGDVRKIKELIVR